MPIRNMYDQPRYNPQGAGPFFADGRAMQALAQGVVPREAPPDVQVATGRLADDSGWVLTIPDSVVREAAGFAALATRGQGRYEIYCAPCHSSTGDGRGIMVTKGMNPPSSYFDARLRTMPDGQIFGTITRGIRVMPPYGHSIPVADRWAIVAYVRVLQRVGPGRAVAANAAEVGRGR